MRATSFHKLQKNAFAGESRDPPSSEFRNGRTEKKTPSCLACCPCRRNSNAGNIGRTLSGAKDENDPPPYSRLHTQLVAERRMRNTSDACRPSEQQAVRLVAVCKLHNIQNKPASAKKTKYGYSRNPRRAASHPNMYPFQGFVPSMAAQPPADELWSLLHNWLHIKKPASPQTAALRSRVGQRVEWISIVYSSRFVHVIYVRRLQKKSDRAMKNCA